uniref:Uncharacterized protein n=1 Tax=Rhizophora mucronata TaxID=61149 RepID=A0A2P2NED8_RHIMU
MEQHLNVLGNSLCKITINAVHPLGIVYVI